jgi:hypothetical protein
VRLIRRVPQGRSGDRAFTYAGLNGHSSKSTVGRALERGYKGGD